MHPSLIHSVIVRSQSRLQEVAVCKFLGIFRKNFVVCVSDFRLERASLDLLNLLDSLELLDVLALLVVELLLTLFEVQIQVPLSQHSFVIFGFCN